MSIPAPFRSAFLIAACLLLAPACNRSENDGAPPAAAEPAPKPAQTSDAPATTPAATPAATSGETSAPKVEPTPREVVEMKALTVVAPAGWVGDYNEVLESWTFEKHTPVADGTRAPNRFYIDVLPSDAPRDLEAYAKGLQDDREFQDSGYLFIEIESTKSDASGWLIVGTSKDMSDDEDEGEPSFVMYRAAKNVYCRGGTFVDEALRDEAIAGCRSI